jgi:hypothetical protein
LIVHQPDALVPVKLIGRGESSPAEVPEPVKPPARPPARFSIRPLKRAKRPGANEYEVFDGDTLVARYWHDFRGEEHGIIFVDGRRDDWPVDRNGDFVVSAGPFLLDPSQAAVAYLTRMLGPS